MLEPKDWNKLERIATQLQELTFEVNNLKRKDKEIVIIPQAGDVWQHTSICFIHDDAGGRFGSVPGMRNLIRVYSTNISSPIPPTMIHGRNGWTLLYRENKPYVG